MFDDLSFLALPVTVSSLIFSIILVVVGSVILWLTGLLVAVIFFALTVGSLYALNKGGVLDVDKNKWLLCLPFVMFFTGLGLDEIDVLSFQPLSLTDSGQSIGITWVLLGVIILLLILDLVVSRE